MHAVTATNALLGGVARPPPLHAFPWLPARRPARRFRPSTFVFVGPARPDNRRSNDNKASHPFPHGLHHTTFRPPAAAHQRLLDLRAPDDLALPRQTPKDVSDAAPDSSTPSASKSLPPVVRDRSGPAELDPMVSNSSLHAEHF